MTYKNRPLTKFEQRRMEYERRKRQEYFEQKKCERLQAIESTIKKRKQPDNPELIAKLKEAKLKKLMRYRKLLILRDRQEHKFRDLNLKDFL
jgi:hypothetical protein